MWLPASSEGLQDATERSFQFVPINEMCLLVTSGEQGSCACPPCISEHLPDANRSRVRSHLGNPLRSSSHGLGIHGYSNPQISSPWVRRTHCTTKPSCGENNSDIEAKWKHIWSPSLQVFHWLVKMFLLWLAFNL